MRVLGVDYGEKRVGLAVSDPEGRIASPLRTLRVRSDEDACAQVAAAAREQGCGRVVVGLARTLRGRMGAKARACEAFADKLRAQGLTVDLFDERLTTVAAERSLQDQGLSRGKRADRVDAVAAQMILQAYLSAQRGQLFPEESA